MDYHIVLDAARTPELNALTPAPYIAIDTPVAAGSPELLHALFVLEELSTMVMALRPDTAADDGERLYPLEGVWTVMEDDGRLSFDERVMPGTIMMRQADNLPAAEFDELRHRLARVIEPGQQRYLEAARLMMLDEGRCAQILHMGPYNDEPASFTMLARFLQEHQLRRRSSQTHREIYLVDAQTAQPADYQTVLRVQVEDDGRPPESLSRSTQ